MILDDFEMADGHHIEAEVIWQYDGHDGIGSYEYHGSKEYDQGDPVYSISKVTILAAYDEDGNKVDLKLMPREQIVAWENEICNSDLECDPSDFERDYD
jgi:hypothetical protein